MDWVVQIAIAVFVGVAVWYLTSRHNELRRATERLQDERRKVYIQALEPYIRSLAGTKHPSEAKRAISQVASFEHRRAIFELNLTGSDDVVIAMNELMQSFYRQKEGPTQNDTKNIIDLWGNVLLAIRRDVGNKRTKLKPIDMFRGQISDIDKYFGP